MKHNFTPGPWGLMPDNKLQITNMVGHPDPLYHAEVNGNNPDQCQADARLIAAAPDLFSALDELMAELDSREPEQGTIFRDTAGMTLARDALAKVKG